MIGNRTSSGRQDRSGQDKTEAEAYDKIKAVPAGEDVRAYGVVNRWLTDFSGFGLSEQAGRLMHPHPPKKEEELSEHVDAWHGDEYKLPAMYKINALRTVGPKSILSCGKQTVINRISPSHTRSC